MSQSSPEYTNADLVREVIKFTDAAQDVHVTMVESTRKLVAAEQKLSSKLDPSDASVAPAPDKLPRAGSDGKIDAGWLPENGVTAEQLADVQAKAQAAQNTATAAQSAVSIAQSTAETANADTGVTAGSYGLAADDSSGTFSVPYIIVNSKGKITQAANHTVSMPAPPQVGPASASALGMVQIGNGLKITPEGILYLDPWDIFPLRAPLAVQNVKFSGRNPIMPGETAARTNWLLCDGGTDGLGGNVPDLRGRFLLGSDASHADGSTGGSAEHAHSLSGSVGATTLSARQLGDHWHYIGCASSNGYGAAFTYSSAQDPNSYLQLNVSGGYGLCGNPSSSYKTNAALTSSANNISSSQSHTHSMSGAAASGGTLPPYYALAYLIRIR